MSPFKNLIQGHTVHTVKVDSPKVMKTIQVFTIVHPDDDQCLQIRTNGSMNNPFLDKVGVLIL